MNVSVKREVVVVTEWTFRFLGVPEPYMWQIRDGIDSVEEHDDRYLVLLGAAPATPVTPARIAETIHLLKTSLLWASHAAYEIEKLPPGTSAVEKAVARLKS